MAVTTARHEEWLAAGTLDALSSTLGESSRFRELRETAGRAFRELPIEPDPLYRKYGYFAGVDLTGVDPLEAAGGVRRPMAAPDTVFLLHDAQGTHAEIPPGLEQRGVRLETFEQLLREESASFLEGTDPHADRLTALGLATLNRGYRLTLPADLDRPVRVQDITVISGPKAALSVRRVLRVGHRSRLLMSEEIYSTGGDGHHQRLLGSSTELSVGDGARAAYLTLHAPDLALVAVHSRSGRVGAGARLGWVWTGFGGFRTKVRNHTTLPGTGSDLEDLQAFYGTNDQAYDSSIHITHQGTDTHGQSVTRGVFRDTARGMSRGLVRIEKEARKTVSYISEHAMLLSKGARSDTIPILEILCRDVKATHSTSVAPVDPEKVFYLGSRGFPETESVRMIGEGFLSHVLEKAPFQGLREALYPYLAARWEGRTIDWAQPETVGLPPLEFRGSGAETDWRFDAKLR